MSRPIELDAGVLAFFPLPQLATELREREEYQRSGVSAVTLARDGHATLVLAAFSPDVVHSLEALEDATFLITIGGRERPHPHGS